MWSSMRDRSKGQSQVVTAVLLGGILVVGISSAYTWGVPLLQKNQDVSNLQDTVSSLQDLEEEIVAVSQRGGSSEVSINVRDGFFEVLPENDTIVYTGTTNAAYVATGQWVPLNENDMNGVPEAGFGGGYGIQNQDRPGVLIARARQEGDEYQTTFKIVFRELQDLESNQGYKIDLVGDGNLEASGGTHNIVITQGEETTEQGASATNGPLERQQVQLRIE